MISQVNVITHIVNCGLLCNVWNQLWDLSRSSVTDSQLRSIGPRSSLLLSSPSGTPVKLCRFAAVRAPGPCATRKATASQVPSRSSLYVRAACLLGPCRCVAPTHNANAALYGPGVPGPASPEDRLPRSRPRRRARPLPTHKATARGASPTAARLITCPPVFAQIYPRPGYMLARRCIFGSPIIVRSALHALSPASPPERGRPVWPLGFRTGVDQI
jgi:hypothetical protein